MHPNTHTLTQIQPPTNKKAKHVLPLIPFSAFLHLFPTSSPSLHCHPATVVMPAPRIATLVLVPPQTGVIWGSLGVEPRFGLT